MIACTLLCPSCSAHFKFESGNGGMPENIVCSKCGHAHAFNDYSALMKCPHCNVNLKIPVSLFSQKDLCCPKCNGKFNVWAAHELTETFDSSANALFRIGNEKKAMLQENTVFDKYRIIKLLGKGGMAEVYLAEHIFLKQKCALKIMKQSSVGNDLVSIKRFVREAKISHSIDHPNITKVYDVGSDLKTKNFFIAMEFIEGENLQSICSRKKFSEEELMNIGVEMSKALIELALHNVVHRDIKPSNIMVTADGTLKMMDLGIAKLESGDSGEMTLTVDQSAIGTPGYASPEQCRSAKNVDARSDIYCLGATLYHLATGKAPFSGDTLMEIILKVMQGKPEPLAKLRPDLSHYFVELIEKMMQKDPDKRPKNAVALLKLFQKKKSVFSGFLNRFVQCWNRKLLIGAGFVLILLTVCICWFFRNTDNSSEITEVAKQGKTNALSAEKPLPEKSGPPVFENPPKPVLPEKFGPPVFENPPKPVLPENGIRSLQYRIDLAKWKRTQMVNSRESWYLKKEQIAFYNSLLNRLISAEALKKQIKEYKPPQLSESDHKRLQDMIRNRYDLDPDLYPLDSMVVDPDSGKKYTLTAYYCSGLLPCSYSKQKKILSLFYDPDYELMTDHMKKAVGNIQRTEKDDQGDIIFWIIYEAAHRGRDDIDHFDKQWSLLEYFEKLHVSSYLKGHKTVSSSSLLSWRNMKLMLNFGCDPNVVFSDGQTLLHFAAKEHGQIEIVRQLYFLGFDKWNQENKWGETAYCLAIRYGNQPVIDFLEKVPGINKHTDRKDQIQNQFFQAVVQGDIYKINEAMYEGAVENFIYFPRRTVLAVAAEHNQLQAFKHFEKKIPLANSDKGGQSYDSLLKSFAKGYSLDVLEYFLEKYSKPAQNPSQEEIEKYRKDFFWSSDICFIIPYILHEHGKDSPDKAIAMFDLCKKYGWSPTAKKDLQLYLAHELSNMHPRIKEYFRKENILPLRKNGLPVSFSAESFDPQKRFQQKAPPKAVPKVPQKVPPKAVPKVPQKVPQKVSFSMSLKGWGTNRYRVNRSVNPRKEIRVPVGSRVYFKFRYRITPKVPAVFSLRTPSIEASTSVKVNSAEGEIVTSITSQKPCCQGKIQLLMQRPGEKKTSIIAEFPCLILWEKKELVSEPAADEEKEEKAEIPSQSEWMYPARLDKDGFIKLLPSGHDRISIKSAFFLKAIYKPPYTIRTVCKVNGKDLRFKFSNGIVIFNGMMNSRKLQLDIPNLKTSDRKKADGSLPANQWVEIKIAVFSQKIEIYVDGKLRNSSTGSFYPSLVGIYTCFSGSAVIKSFSVTSN